MTTRPVTGRCARLLAAAALFVVQGTAGAQAPADDSPLIEAERIAQSDASRAIEIAEAVLADATAQDNVADQAAAQRVIAAAYYFQADFPRSLERAIAAERLYVETGDLYQQAGVLSLIGAIHGSSKQYERALEVYERAYRVSTQAGSGRGQAVVLMNLGKTHYDLANYDAALDHYERSLAQYTELQAQGIGIRPDAIQFARMGVADALLRQGKPADAIERVQTVLAEADEASLIFQNGLGILGEAHLLRGDLDDAETHLTRALAEAQRTQRPAKQIDVLRLLSQLAVRRGQTQRALALQRTVNELNLDIYNERNSAELARLEARYENDLRDQQIQLQALAIQRNQLWLLAVSAVAVAALLAVGVIFWLYRTKRRANRELQTLAETDPLTGLLNRRSMTAFLGALTDDVREESAVCLIDLDDFKQVNDRYGHDVGDRLLVAVAETVESGLRSTDRVARWGGEEFLAALTGRTHEHAAAIAERLCRQIQRMAFESAPGDDFAVSASLGLAYFDAGVATDEVLRRADKAMYHAKAKGKNRVSVFDAA